MRALVFHYEFHKVLFFQSSTIETASLISRPRHPSSVSGISNNAPVSLASRICVLVPQILRPSHSCELSITFCLHQKPHFCPVDTSYCIILILASIFLFLIHITIKSFSVAPPSRRMFALLKFISDTLITAHFFPSLW